MEKIINYKEHLLEIEDKLKQLDEMEASLKDLQKNNPDNSEIHNRCKMLLAELEQVRTGMQTNKLLTKALDTMNDSEELTKENRDLLTRHISVSSCTCGHLRAEHNRFISGIFVGCSVTGCDCLKFKNYDLVTLERREIR